MGDVNLTFDPSAGLPPLPPPQPPPPTPDSPEAAMLAVMGALPPPPGPRYRPQEQAAPAKAGLPIPGARPRIARKSVLSAKQSAPPTVSGAPAALPQGPQGHWPAASGATASPKASQDPDESNTDEEEWADEPDDPDADALVRIGRLDERLRNMRGAVDRIRGQVKMHLGGVGALEGSLSTLRANVNTARKELDELRDDQERADWIMKIMFGRLRSLAKAQKLHELMVMGHFMGYETDPEQLSRAQQEVQDAERRMDKIEEDAAEKGITLPD